MYSKKLGKGLSALFGANNIPQEEKDNFGIFSLPLISIIQDSSQPRKYFDDKAIEELTLSIKRYGLLQPIIVKKTTDNKYLIIAGERRWRAANLAGLEEIPVIIRESDDAESFTIALIENLQRENLNPLEESESKVTLPFIASIRFSTFRSPFLNLTSLSVAPTPLSL